MISSVDAKQFENSILKSNDKTGQKSRNGVELALHFELNKS